MSPIFPSPHSLLAKCQVTISKVWRGYRIRQHFLPATIYRETIIFLKYCPKIEELPRASSGTAPVYFLPQLPTILKNTGSEKNKMRWRTMRMVRRLCKQNGFINLKIPLASPYQIWLIEEKLSVTEFKQKGQVGLYCENREKFSNAATQMTKLLCHLIYPDILTSIHPYQQESDIPLARYDNLLLFLDHGLGKIGLVDLEHVRFREPCMSHQELFEIAYKGLLLFPYHFSEVLAAVNEEFPEIELDTNALQQKSEQIVRSYNKIYHDHSEYVFDLRPTYSPPLLQTFDVTNPCFSQIMDKMLMQIELCTHSIITAGSKIEQLQSRTFSIQIRSVISDYPSTKEILREVLIALVHCNKISYANIYLNYAKEPMIRVHY